MKQLSLDGFYLDGNIVKHNLVPNYTWKYITDYVFDAEEFTMPFITSESRRVMDLHVSSCNGVHLVFPAFLFDNRIYNSQRDIINTLPSLDEETFDVLVHVGKIKRCIEFEGFKHITSFSHDGDEDMTPTIKWVNVFVKDNNGSFKMKELEFDEIDFFYDGAHSANTVPLNIPGRALYVGLHGDFKDDDIVPFDYTRWGR